MVYLDCSPVVVINVPFIKFYDINHGLCPSTSGAHFKIPLKCLLKEIMMTIIYNGI